MRGPGLHELLHVRNVQAATCFIAKDQSSCSEDATPLWVLFWERYGLPRSRGSRGPVSLGSGSGADRGRHLGWPQSFHSSLSGLITAERMHYGHMCSYSCRKAGESDSSDSDQDEAPCPRKKKHQDRGSDPGPSPPKVLTFDPTEIVHPRSTNWVPLPEVVTYVQSHFRQGFDKEVRVRLRSECPHPNLAGEV
ncbi:hypothetical protein NDU88_007036 [Pleurodeles waltl]|uniref:Uncharacterized protein n=1 Tax=Pleurodeles waltl TaxID=8319 RepID=A0AAV7RQN4_PLEWA|nr:hypothetical protein NDU88_007036 [Pleurodeles waltl]